MNVLVVSDIHNCKTALRETLEQSKEKDCEAIIFCGDCGSSETFSVLVNDTRPLYAVFGNIERDKTDIIAMAKKASHVMFDPYVVSFPLDKRTVSATHYPDAAETLARQGKYDAVFHGHTHRGRVIYKGKVLIGNPGEISGHITGKRSFGIYDTEGNSFSVLPVAI